MSLINGLSSSSPLTPVTGASKPTSTTGAAPSAARSSDSVEITGYLQLLKSNDVRSDKVASVKSALESGSYDEDSKLNAILDKVLDDITN